MNKFSWTCLAAFALAIVIAGCGDGGPSLYKAGGTVTYKSAPVPDAFVTFAYDDGEFASGVTGPDGKFQLVYKGKPGGAALGKCKVTVVKNEGPKVAADPAASATGTPKSAEEYKKREEAKKAMMMGMANNANLPKKSLIPIKYADPATSGFNFEITTDVSKNDFKLDLVD